MKMLSLAITLAVVCELGTACAMAQTLVLPPTVPQHSQAGDLVGFTMQNAGTATVTTHPVTFGQVFPVGAVAPTASLYARDSDNSQPGRADGCAGHAPRRLRPLRRAHHMVSPARGRQLGQRHA